VSATGPRPTPDVARLKPYVVPSASRRDLLRLDFNENLAGPSPRVLEALRGLGADDVALYPDETAARAAVARWCGLAPGLDLVLTSGVDEGIRLLCDCFVRSGETVLLLEPGYPMYRFYATLAGANVLSIDYRRDLSFPESALREAVRSESLRRDCRLLIVGDPNNPTGTPAPDGLIEDIAAALPSTIVLVDEAYAEFAGRSSMEALRSLPNLIVARTFSKAYGLAGLRAGVLLGDRETLSWVARMRSPYAVNSLALLALQAALADETYVTRCVEDVRRARSLLAEGLAELGVPTYPSAANFLVARFGDSAPALREALRRRAVAVRDRSDHELLRGTLRIGVGTREQARICLAAVAAALAEVAGGRR
jgi:histidinol-phosphate aminotransferase